MKLTRITAAVFFIAAMLFFAGAASAYEVSYYKDSKVGIFKVTLDAIELKGHPVKAIVPVYDGGALSEVYTFDSRSEKRDEVYVDDSQKQSKDKMREKLDRLQQEQSAIYKSRGELNDENDFLEKYLKRVKNGEFQMNEAGIKTQNDKIAGNKEKIKALDARLEPLDKELREISSEFYSHNTHNVTKKELNKDVKFYVFGRFFKSGPASFSLVNAESSEVFLNVNLKLIDREDKTNKDILKKWLEVQSNYFAKLRSGSAGSVFSYIAAQSGHRFAQSTDESEVLHSRIQQRQGGGPDLYSMSSGVLAIQEALQLDRMTGGLSRERGGNTGVETLKAPVIKSHPFELMLQGKTPKTYSIDALVPSDFYYLHFSNIRDQIELSELMDKWGTNFLQMMQVSSTNSMIKEKYLGQLCLKVSELTKLFGDKVIDDMAICGNDPFLEDGTDLSVIFSVKNKAVFDLNVSRYFLEAKAAFKNIKEETIDASKFKIKAFYTPDGSVSSYSCYINDFMLYSNSRSAILKIIDTFENPRKSMAKADDFLYMRTVYETGAENENAFLYLSDAHIRKLVGPEWKIGRQRRLNCAASLRTINNAMVLYYMDKKTDRPSLETLIAGGYLEDSYIFCPDGGSYSIDPDTLEPCCSLHRRLRYITPISEIIPKYASNDEALQYKRFVEQYNAYWTKFFDPVGIRIKNSEKNISLETCILPLVENTIYNWLSTTSGGAPVKFYASLASGTILSVRAKINTKNEENVKLFEHMLSATSFTAERFLKFIGDNISVNLLDSDIRFTLDPLLGSMGMMRGSESFALFGSVLLSALNHPLYIALDVTDMKEAETFLIELLKYAEEENSKMRNGFFQTDLYVYKVHPVENGPAIYSINYKLFLIGLNLHVMIHDNKFIIATKRSILTDILKNTPNKGEASESNFEFEINSGNFNEISKTYNIVWAEKMRSACHSNLWPIYVLNKLRGVDMSGINGASLSANGYYPYCPAGGEYRYDGGRGIVSCTLHGDVYNPRQPMELDEKNELVMFFKSLKKVKAALRFTVHGIMTRVIIERQ